MHPDTPGSFMIYPVSIFYLKKFFSYLNDNASVHCILVFPSGLLFPPMFGILLSCMFHFYPPHCFHPFRLFKELFLKHAVYITEVTFTLSNLLFHCPLCRDNPGQRNVVHYFAGLQVSILDFCAGMFDLESSLYATSLEVPLLDDISLFTLVLLIGAPHPWIFGFILTSFKVKFKGLCFFWQPLNSVQLFLNSCHSDPIIRYTLIFYWSLVAKGNPNWICLFMRFGLRYPPVSIRPSYSLKNCFAS